MQSWLVVAAFPGRLIARGATRIGLLARTVSLIAFGLLTSLSPWRDAMAESSCKQYPISVRPAEGVQAAARAELGALMPGAAMTWNSNRGTLSSIFQFALPLPGCTSGQDVNAEVFSVLAAHPALFQLDLSEWQTPAPLDCKYLGNDEILSMGRHHLAGQSVAEDVFVYALTRINGVVHLTFVNGTYLPVVSTDVGDAMAACTSLSEETATARARKTPLQATVFSQCRKTGAITYTPKANDVFQFSSDTWIWQEDIGQVLLTGQRTLRVIVNPVNYTPELLSSNARCPVSDGDDHRFTIGFDVAFDVYTGEITNIKPGLDCIVC